MRRTASELINELELRVARLERRAAKLKSYDFVVDTDVCEFRDGKLDMNFFKKGEGLMNVEVELALNKRHYRLTNSNGVQYLVPVRNVKEVEPLI